VPRGRKSARPASGKALGCGAITYSAPIPRRKAIRPPEEGHPLLVGRAVVEEQAGGFGAALAVIRSLAPVTGIGVDPGQAAQNRVEVGDDRRAEDVRIVGGAGHARDRHDDRAFRGVAERADDRHRIGVEHDWVDRRVAHVRALKLDFAREPAERRAGENEDRESGDEVARGALQASEDHPKTGGGEDRPGNRESHQELALEQAGDVRRNDAEDGPRNHQVLRRFRSGEEDDHDQSDDESGAPGGSAHPKGVFRGRGEGVHDREPDDENPDADALAERPRFREKSDDTEQDQRQVSDRDLAEARREREGGGPGLEDRIVAKDIDEPKRRRQRSQADDGDADRPLRRCDRRLALRRLRLARERCGEKADTDDRHEEHIVAVDVHQDAERDRPPKHGPPTLAATEDGEEGQRDQAKADHEQGVRQHRREDEPLRLPDIGGKAAMGEGGDEPLDRIERRLGHRDAERLPEHEAEAAADAHDEQREFRDEQLPPKLEDEAVGEDHEQVSEADPREGHRDGGPEYLRDPAENQEVEVEGKPRLGIGREPVVEEDTPFDGLSHPRRIDHMVVDVDLEAEVSTPWRRDEPADQGR